MEEPAARAPDPPEESRSWTIGSFLLFRGGGVGEGAIRGEPPSRGEEPRRWSEKCRTLGTGLDQRLPTDS
jgi:hypothetical protein